MQFHDPRVHFLATTAILPDGLSDYLTDIGAPEWDTDAKSDSETLVEVAGRSCYRSFAPGLNPNVSRVREGNGPYIGNLLSQQHGSTMEHAALTFAIVGCSRVLTHELVRHRAGSAFSQESLRFVRLDKLVAYYPQVGFGYDTMLELWDSLDVDAQRAALAKVIGKGNVFPGDDEELARHTFATQSAAMLLGEFTYCFEEAEKKQEHISDILCLDQCKSFPVKKKITSAMRRLAPDGLGTAIIWSTNHRALREIIEKRTSRHAEEEIRYVFNLVWDVVSAHFPAIYQDIASQDVVDGFREIVFVNHKV